MTKTAYGVCAVVLVLALLGASFAVRAGASVSPAATVANKAPAAASAPTRESLVAFWEDSMQKDPHVSVFKKTAQSGVYDFKTDFFPYSGKLTLLNAVVARSDDGYYEGLYTGILDVELSDAKPAFFKKYAASYAAWKRQNYFYYAAKKAAWFAPSAWEEYMTDAQAQTASPAQARRGLWRQASFWGSLAVPVAALALFLLWARRVGKRAQEINRQALTAQAEQTELLKKILATLERGLQG